MLRSDTRPRNRPLWKSNSIHRGAIAPFTGGQPVHCFSLRSAADGLVFPLCETSLVCCPRLIQCDGYGSFVWLSDLLMNGANRSIGIGRMVVVLCSLEI